MPTVEEERRLSVAAIILEPENRSFYVPVATEAFFRKCWIPAIRQLNLAIVSLFDPGVDLRKDDFPLLCEELDRIKTWADKQLTEEEHAHICSRIDGLIARLKEAFAEEGVVIFIG
ncbi:hypothetical protein [Paenibacillus ginsengihumi]|uniref:hypothetical protein n=1 Tax=Paenibacillus ginsengihumi TaxID=431596 RepID=UPI000370B3F2|nr:hypothetical protein [Paenibacillus ginsengihumi]